MWSTQRGGWGHLALLEVLPAGYITSELHQHKNKRRSIYVFKQGQTSRAYILKRQNHSYSTKANDDSTLILFSPFHPLFPKLHHFEVWIDRFFFRTEPKYGHKLHAHVTLYEHLAESERLDLQIFTLFNSKDRTTRT
jgi:hypothetical protein